MDLQLIQGYLSQHGIDAWLVYDFRGTNPVLSQLLGGNKWTTRRIALLIPQAGRPMLLLHRIDAPQFAGVDADQTVYLAWPQWQQWLREKLATVRRVAMEFAPGGDLPVVSIVDGGTIDFIRSIGPEVVTSADLMQLCAARWSPEIAADHFKVAKLVDQIKDEAFGLIRSRRAARKKVTEYGVQQFILRRFAEEKLDPDHPPIVACNAHSADPHFEVSAASPDEIRQGDWILIDLWARTPGNQHVFADITWCAYAGDTVPDEHRRVFDAVKQARDAALHAAVNAWNNKQPIAGWEIDDAAMHTLRSSGYEQHIIHRTGHSLSPGAKIHGLGVNIDNFETRDTRLLLPGIGFTIEPGLYLQGNFGCRLEIDVFVDPEKGPLVTGGTQREVVLV